MGTRKRKERKRAGEQFQHEERVGTPEPLRRKNVDARDRARAKKMKAMNDRLAKNLRIPNINLKPPTGRNTP